MLAGCSLRLSHPDAPLVLHLGKILGCDPKECASNKSKRNLSSLAARHRRIMSSFGRLKHILHKSMQLQRRIDTFKAHPVNHCRVPCSSLQKGRTTNVLVEMPICLVWGLGFMYVIFCAFCLRVFPCESNCMDWYTAAQLCSARYHNFHACSP